MQIRNHEPTEASMSERETYAQRLLNMPTDMILLIEPDGTILLANETFAQYVGHTPDELTGTCVWDYFSPAVLEFRRGKLAQVLETRRPLRFEEPGRVGYFDTLVYPILDEQGQVIQVAILARDISDRKSMEAAVRASEERHRALVETSPDGITLVGLDGVILTANRQFLKMYGYQSLGELLHETTSGLDLVIPEDREVAQANMALILAEGTKRDAQYTVRRKDGSTFCIETSASLLRDAHGQPTAFVVMSRDISARIQAEALLHEAQRELENRVAERTTELSKAVHDLRLEIAMRRQTEQALQYQRDFAESIVDTAQAIIVALSPTATILRINAFLQDISGYTQDEVIGKDWHDTFIPDNEREQVRHLFYESLNGADLWGNINAIITKDGRALQIEWYDKTLKNDFGQTIGLLAIGQDVTARLHVEEQIRQNAARAETLARLANRLNAQLDLNTLLEVVCEEAAQALPRMSMTSVRLYDEELDGFYIAASRAAPAFYQQSAGLIPRATYAAHLTPSSPLIVIPDTGLLEEDYPDAELFKRQALRTAISVGIFHNDSLIASLNVASTGEVYIPSEDELAFLQAIAGQASVAIANARLFKQVSNHQKRLQALSERLLEIQETERRQIARELHDEIGQMLTYLKLMLESIEVQWKRGETPRSAVADPLSQAQAMVNQLIQQVRELSLELAPRILDDLGLLHALLALFEGFTKKTGIEVDFKHSGLEARFPANIETAAFRIVQEALTNVARHTEEKFVSVRLWTDRQVLGLLVEDRGPGFDLQQALGSRFTGGIAGMRERAALCGGLLELESSPGNGVSLTVELPLNVQDNPGDIT